MQLSLFKCQCFYLLVVHQIKEHLTINDILHIMALFYFNFKPPWRSIEQDVPLAKYIAIWLH